MNVSIIGWYGTETIGDRAILAGILLMLNKNYGKINLFLGSLYPFFSERTINEDSDFYSLLGISIDNCEIFNSKKKEVLDEYINKSDIMIMGGGPLCDIEEMYMIRYAFSYAKKRNNIKTMVCGCGIGPLFIEQYRKCTLDIVTLADVIILRDKLAKNNLQAIFVEYGKNNLPDNVYTAFDPAIVCALVYKNIVRNKDNQDENLIVANMRKFPEMYSNNKNLNNHINENLEKILINITEIGTNKNILLVPMHYFFIGDDDRCFLNEMVLKNKKVFKNVKVQNTPLNLQETLDIFAEATVTFGTRFHSVVLQTIVNGNNYILDYTEPSKGKIAGFIHDIDEDGFYNNRYINLQKYATKINIEKFLTEKKKFYISRFYFKTNMDVYDSVFKTLF